MKTKKQATHPSHVGREVMSVLCLALAAFAFLCLVSHAAEDPSWSVAAPEARIHNLGGRVGAIVSDLLFTALGLSAYLSCAILLFIALVGFGLCRFEWSWRQFLGLLILGLSVPVFGTLFETRLPGDAGPSTFGGLWGQSAAVFLVSYFNHWGSILLVLSLVFISILLTTRISLGALAGTFIRTLIREIPPRVQRFSQWAVSTAVIIRARIAKAYRARKRSEAKNKTFTPIFTRLRVWLSTLRRPLPSSPTAPAVKLPSKTQPPLAERAAAPTSPPNAESSDLPSDVKIFKKKTDDKKKGDTDQLDFLPPAAGEFTLPSLSLLDTPPETKTEINEESLRANAQLLENKLRDFGVEGHVTEIHPGPVITMYEFVPAPGVKINKIVNLADDLSLAMEGRQVRIVAPLPDKAAVGLEIPNHVRETVWLKDILAHPKFKREKSRLLFALGKDIAGECFVADLTKMPHLLVAGATGAGKSVSVNTMILSLLYQSAPEDVRLLMVDPKMLELSVYQGIPHLLLPVVTDPKKAAQALRWAVKEMERRYQLMADLNARNIINYNKRLEAGEHAGKKSLFVNGEEIMHDRKFPYIVIIIDELADLMMVAGKEVEECITRLAQMARAAGIHLILATQRPSVDVLTGVIKANFPSRISFKVSSKYDARTILDRIGSEQLLGNGDMLFLPPGTSQILRIHGAFVTENEIARVVDFLKKQGEPQYREEEILAPDTGGGEGGTEPFDDELYDAAVAIVAETKQASISMVQRRLRIGYNRAARLIEQMQAQGVVSAPNGAKGREVLIAEVR